MPGRISPQVSTVDSGFNFVESKEKRKQGVKKLRTLAIHGIIWGSISVLLGVVSTGLGITNPTYPKINGNAILAGILMIIAGVFGKRATNHDVFNEAGRRFRAYVIVHYTLSITNISMSVLQIAFTGWAVGECLSTEPEVLGKCQPYELPNTVLHSLVILVGVILLGLSLAGSIFFCIYQRAFGFYEAQERIQIEMGLASKPLNTRQNSF